MRTRNLKAFLLGAQYGAETVGAPDVNWKLLQEAERKMPDHFCEELGFPEDSLYEVPTQTQLSLMHSFWEGWNSTSRTIEQKLDA